MKSKTGYVFTIGVILALVCALGFVFPHHDPHFPWQKIPAFDAVFGFIGCLVIILFSKTIGKVLHTKNEDYYNRTDRKE